MSKTHTFSSRFSVALALSAAMAVTAPISSFAATPKIGIAAQVKNQVTADSKSLSLGNDVFSGQRIHTGQASNAQLTFLDQTNLTIGSQSDVVLDKFVFDPARGAGDVALTATQGALRFISGAQNPNTYKINTPVATISIRGTLAYNFIFGGYQYTVNGYGHVTAVIKSTGQSIDIPPGKALVMAIPADPNHPNGFFIKWDLGALDIDRLAQLLPQFVDLPDGGQSLNDQHNAAGASPFVECDYWCCEYSDYGG